jgi:hypothetical protein
MSEFTAWYPVTNPTQSISSGTNWDDLTNIVLDDASFSPAISSGGGSWTNDLTTVVDVNGNPAIDPLIPDNSTFDSVEVRMYFEQPQQMFFAQVAINRSSNQLTPVFAEELGIFTANPELLQVDYSLPVDDTEGRAIAEGGNILYVYGKASASEAAQWQENWRFAEMRIEFTRAPFTPRTAFIAMF